MNPQPAIHPVATKTEHPECSYCKERHDSRLACPEYEAQRTRKKMTKRPSGRKPGEMPTWFAEAMKVACLQDHIATLPWYKRAWIHVLAYFKADIPQWAVPPGWSKTK